jgi:hypothetical protein
MSFDDLPDDWPDLPLDTPGVGADVADLVVGIADRENGCLGFLLTDDQGRLAQPLVVGGVSDDAEPAVVAASLDAILAPVRDRGGSLGFVRGRPGSVLLTDGDRAWHEAVLDACRHADVPVIGAWLATPAVVRPFPAALTGQDVIAS